MFSRKWISGFLIGSFTLVGVLSFSTAAGAQTKTTRLSVATGGTGGVLYVVGGAIKYYPEKKVRLSGPR
jgi:TRAP-type uncharacterized transport system substrate-binding protein